MNISIEQFFAKFEDIEAITTSNIPFIQLILDVPISLHSFPIN